MTCLQKVERTLDILEVSQNKKPGLVLATGEEVPALEIAVAKSFFCIMAATNSGQDQIYVIRKSDAARCKDGCIFYIGNNRRWMTPSESC